MCKVCLAYNSFLQCFCHLNCRSKIRLVRRIATTSLRCRCTLSFSPSVQVEAANKKNCKDQKVKVRPLFTTQLGRQRDGRAPGKFFVGVALCLRVGGGLLPAASYNSATPGRCQLYGHSDGDVPILWPPLSHQKDG